MRRWFPVLAVLATSCWGVVLVVSLGGGSSRTVAAWFVGPAVATLAVHGLAILPLRVALPRSSPVWVAVQADKHRRKGAWFAAWGSSAVVLGGSLVWGVGASSRWLVLVAAAGNLGFQPGLFVAEWLAIAARSRLDRLVADGNQSTGVGQVFAPK